MCVIVASESGKIPTDDALDSMHRQNSDGIGLAWRKPNGTIEYRRGLTLTECKSHLKHIKQDRKAYVLHFRWATIGPAVPRLTHPFPVTKDRQELFRLKGHTNAVLAHNGTWFPNQKSLESLRDRFGLGKDVSDSAIIAVLWAYNPKGAWQMLSKGFQKLAVLDRKQIMLYGGFTQEGSIYYSNTAWKGWTGYTKNWWKGGDVNDGYYGYGGYGGHSGYLGSTCGVNGREMPTGKYDQPDNHSDIKLKDGTVFKYDPKDGAYYEAKKGKKGNETDNWLQGEDGIWRRKDRIKEEDLLTEQEAAYQLDKREQKQLPAPLEYAYTCMNCIMQRKHTHHDRQNEK